MRCESAPLRILCGRSGKREGIPRLSLLLIGLCGLASYVTPLQGEERETVVIEAESLEEESPYGNTGSTTRIHPARESDMPHTMGRLLEREASVRVNRYGGRGSYNTLSIRGSNPNQTDLYIDGIPLTGASTGEVNLSDLNPDAFDTIEIFRSGDYAVSSIGGSVNLIPHQSGKECRHSRIGTLAGSYQTAGLGVEHCAGDDSFYTVRTKGEVSRQKYLFHNDNGTPLINRQDDSDDIRRNAWYREFFSTLYAGTRSGDTRIGFLLDSAYRENGIPGPVPRQTEKSERHHMRHTAGLTFDTRGLFIDALRVASRLYYTESRTKFFDPLQELNASRPDSRSLSQQYGIVLEPTLYLTDWYQTLRLYMTLQRERLREERRDRWDRYLESLPERIRDRAIIRLEDEIRLLEERLLFSFSGEYRYVRDLFHEKRSASGSDSPGQEKEKEPVTELRHYRVGAKFVAYRAKSTELYLRGGVGTASRTPLFLELFGDHGSILGNPDLVPERSRTVEGGTGVRLHFGTFLLSSELTLFRREIEEMILFVPNSQFTLRAENLDAAEISGAGWSTRATIFGHIRAHCNYTYQKAINRSEVTYLNGNYLPLHPLHELHGGLSWFDSRREVGMEANYVGATFRHRTNEATDYVPSRTLYNLFLSYRFGNSLYGEGGGDRDLRTWSLSAELINVFNKRVTDTNGYPLPGRSLYVSVAYAF